MGCRSCSSRRQRAVTSAPPGTATSGLTIRQASSWLPFPPVVKPPGGWGAFGFSANTPEEAADRLAGQHLAANTFDKHGHDLPTTLRRVLQPCRIPLLQEMSLFLLLLACLRAWIRHPGREGVVYH